MIETEVNSNTVKGPTTLILPLKIPASLVAAANAANAATAVTSQEGKKTQPSVVLDRSKVQRDFTHYFAIFCWIGWTFFYFVLFFAGPLIYYYAPRVMQGIFGLIILSAILPNDLKKQPKWAIDFGDWLMIKAAEYFHLKMILEDQTAIETCGPAIFAMEPHHILPLSIIAFHRKNIGFTGHDMLGCITGICFSIPLMRHIYKWVHADSVDKKNLKKMLSNRLSPVLCPGGVQEVLYLKNSDKECVLYLKKRIGFIKLAMEYGVPVIPVFTFGLHHSFQFWMMENRFLKKIGRKLGFLPMMFFGLWNLPLGPAKPCDYVNVVGKPIPMKQNHSPTEEELHQSLELYIQEITRIYNTYKHEYGMGEIELRIV